MSGTCCKMQEGQCFLLGSHAADPLLCIDEQPAKHHNFDPLQTPCCFLAPLPTAIRDWEALRFGEL